MNATSIWAGNDYAFLPNRGRDGRFSLKCKRVRVRRLIKEAMGATGKTTTFVEVNFVNRDTGEIEDYGHISYYDLDRIRKMPNGNNGTTYKVRATDFVDFWETIEPEYRHLVQKQKDRDAEYERQRAERAAEQERIAQAKQARLDRIMNFLVQHGVKHDWIQSIVVDNYYHDRGTIQLDFKAVERSIKEEQEEGTLSDASSL